jgi:cobalamin biosynthesis protein CobT
MKKNAINTLLGPFQKIARAMSRNWDVQVVPSGYDCCTDGNTIKYPFNADYLDGANQKVLHGLLDHEVAHVAEEREHTEHNQRTPLKIMRDCRSTKERMLLNVFEDIRIEHKYSHIYKGVAENLHEANVNSVDLFKKRHGIDGEASKGKRVNFWHTLGSAIIMKARGYSVDWLPKKFQPFLDAVQQEVEDSTKTSWAKDSHDLALRVINKINDKTDELEQERQERQEQKQEQEKQEGQDKQEGEAQEQEGGSSEGEQEQSDSGQSGDEDQDQEGEGTQNGESNEDEQEGTEQSNPTQGDGDEGEDNEAGSESSEAPKTGTPKQDDSGLSDDELDEACKAGDEAQADADSDDLIKQVKDQVLDIAKGEAKAHRRYIPNPRALARDRWVKPYERKPEHAQAEYNKAKEAVAGQIRGLKGKLLNVIRARAASRMESGHRRGKLDKARLAQVPTGNVNVFQVEKEGETLDTAISVVIDLSGSMGPGYDPKYKAYYAKLMAIALSETFDALNVPFEVIGFHNDWDRTVSDTPGCMRNEPIEYVIFKEFGENYKRVRTRMNHITGNGNNTDGEAVMACALRLAKRPETRKIMFVLSDGMPAGGGVDRHTLCNHLEEVITEITKAGIEVVGIGAMTDHIKDFYNKEHGASGAVINDMTKLAVEVYKLMRAKLLDAKRRAA